MLQAIENPVSNINHDAGNHDNQFYELIQQINFGIKLIKSKKWTLGEYYEHMAEFFDYLGLSADAYEHRELAEKWNQENSAV